RAGGNAEGVRGGQGARRVQGVVRPGEAEPYGHGARERTGEVKGHSLGPLRDVDESIGRARRGAVRAHRAAGQLAGEKTCGARVVGAGDERAAGDDPVREIREGILDVLTGREEIHVVVVDVRHEADLGIERQEGAVVLVGLDHQDVPGSRVRVCPEVAEDGPADQRGVETAGPQSGPRERGRGALPVRAGDGDDALAAGEIAPRVLALPGGDPEAPRRGDLRVGVAVRAAAAIRASRDGSSRSPLTVATRRSGSSWLSGRTIAAFFSATSRALALWWASAAAANGMRRSGTPNASGSAIEEELARPTTRSAAASAAPISSRSKPTTR